MTLTQLVADYGYLAVFAGALFEGETVLLLAGFAAHQGYLSFPWIVLIAFCGGTLGDQLWLFMGRRYGTALLKRFPQLTPATQQVNRLMLRFQVGMIIGVRFMYGLRIAGPIAIGMSDVTTWRFILFNSSPTTLRHIVWATFAITGSQKRRDEGAALLAVRVHGVVMPISRRRPSWRSFA